MATKALTLSVYSYFAYASLFVFRIKASASSWLGGIFEHRMLVSCVKAFQRVTVRWCRIRNVQI